MVQKNGICQIIRRGVLSLSITPDDSSNKGLDDDSDLISKIETNQEELIALSNSDLPCSKVAAALIDIYDIEQ